MHRFITVLVIVALISLIPASSCKTMARAAARYWTKRQIKEFIGNCEEKSAKLIGEEKAKQFCNCAVDVVAEEYQNYNDTKTISAATLLNAAKDCVQQ
jgi:CRISPR/Cas system CSM-associated protein Csm3 (group 7 of RAMP superfamily)